MIVVEEPAQATGAIDRRAQAPLPVGGDEELPLERTISAEGSVNLDQDDPLAEADFHMAYGLYDQAADLLTAALARSPARRELRLKLLDVYFVWENREGFLKQARQLREKIGAEDDPDWNRVVIMGRQLCGNDPLFSGGTSQASVDMDLGLSGGVGDKLDFNVGTDTSRLDLDLGVELHAEGDDAASTRVNLPAWAAGQTQELPTMETPTLEASGLSTMETPTVETGRVSGTMETETLQAARASGTMETPTLEARYGDRTVETPTLSTAKLQVAGGRDQEADQTAEIDLDELGLDLVGLDDVARDMATGLQEAIPEEPALLDLDLSAADVVGEGDESTAEMARSPSLEHITNAMSKKDAAGRAQAFPIDETAEQPAIDRSAITRGLTDTARDLEAIRTELDLGDGAAVQSDTSATMPRQIGKRGPGDQTMTEVGTKLDLARAYLDMGDPDGARSILNEVLEEGEPPQRQEARQLLDSIKD
jgi:pilus assembly protein FimV